MTTKTVFQYDVSGAFIGTTLADESPLEPGVWIMPARTTDVEPPACADDELPQWNGVGWHVIPRPPAPSVHEIALAKIKQFIAANPDVAVFINQGGV
jgi:hypothetical protein